MPLRIVQGAVTVNGSADTSTQQAGVVTAQLAAASLPSVTPASYAWVLSVPFGSLASLSSAVSATPTFTPDVAGNYFLGLNGTYTLPFNVTTVVPNVYAGPIVPANLLAAQAPVPAQGSSLISDAATPGSLLATDSNGLHAPVVLARAGTTAARPTGSTVGLYVGFFYFDTTLHYLVCWDGAVWRNGAGGSV